MAAPWEKYQTQSSGKPWEKYSESSPAYDQQWSRQVNDAEQRKFMVADVEPVKGGKYLPNNLNPYAPTNPATDTMDFLTRVLPESAGKLPGRLAIGAYEAVKGQTDPIMTRIMDGNQGSAANIVPEMATNAYNTLQGLASATVNPTGLMGYEKAKAAWTTDPVGSLLGITPFIKGAKSGAMKQTVKDAASLPVKAVDATFGKILDKTLNRNMTPEEMARSALKPYIGESPVRNQSTAKAIDTFLVDKNKSASGKTFLERNIKEMEEIGGRQNILMDSKGNPRVRIDKIEQSLNDFIADAAETPGVATDAVVAAERVLADIKKNKDYSAIDNSLGLQGVQQMKKNIWQYLKSKGTFGKDSVPMLNDAMWSAADGMMKIVNDVVPEMATENARYGELANLNKMLVKSVARQNNTNLLSFNTAVQLIRGDMKGFGTAIAMKTLDHPTFKSYLAQRMARAQGRKPTSKEVESAVETIKVKAEEQFNPEVLPKETIHSYMGETIPGQPKLGLEDGGVPPRRTTGYNTVNTYKGGNDNPPYTVGKDPLGIRGTYVK